DSCLRFGRWARRIPPELRLSVCCLRSPEFLIGGNVETCELAERAVGEELLQPVDDAPDHRGVDHTCRGGDDADATGSDVARTLGSEPPNLGRGIEPSEHVALFLALAD